MKRIGDILLMVAVVVGIPWLAARVLAPAWTPIAAIVAVGIIARLRAVSTAASRLLEPLRTPTEKQRAIITVAIGLLAAVYFCATAHFQHRDLLPRIHDEHCYLIQARMLAAGELWQPQHALADFFDNFYILARPVYAAIYFPGTALADAPFVKLGAPYWRMPLLAAGLVVALVYNMTTRLVDGVAGIVAAVCVMSNWGMREYATIVMAQMPLTALVLLAFYGWVRWGERRLLRWELAIGAALGWALITRPIDAVAFAIPIGLSMAWLAKDRTIVRNSAGLLAIALAALPFLLLQATLNHGTTGSYFKTPYTAYLLADQPGSAYGYAKPKENQQPASVLQQKRDYIDQFRSEEVRAHTLGNAPRELVRRTFWTFVCTLPAGILAVMLPAGVLGLNERRRLIFVAPLATFTLLYLPNPFFLVHYTVPLVPAMSFLLGLAVYKLARDDMRMRAYFAMLVIAACVAVAPEIRADIRDGVVPPMRLTAMIHQQLRAVVGDNAVVLVRYQAGDNPVEDPVYNDEVVWPDDAPVILAHDLGNRNIELANYYAQRQPSRRMFLLIRRENTGPTLVLHPLGTAGEYAASLREAKVR